MLCLVWRSICKTHFLGSSRSHCDLTSQDLLKLQRLRLDSDCDFHTPCSPFREPHCARRGGCDPISSASSADKPPAATTPTMPAPRASPSAYALFPFLCHPSARPLQPLFPPYSLLTTFLFQSGFYMTLAAIPASFALYKLTRQGTDEQPYFTRLIADKYAQYKQEFTQRNDMHTQMIEQAAADRDVVGLAPLTEDLVLRIVVNGCSLLTRGNTKSVLYDTLLETPVVPP